MSADFNDNNYALNPLFDDRILSDFLPKIKDSAYMRAIEIQQELMNIVEQEMPLSKFIIHKKINADNGYHPSSRCYEIKGFEIPIIDKKKFINKYGSIYGKKIPIMDTYLYRDIFGSSYLFHIGDNAILKDIYLIRTRYQSTLILFDNTLLTNDEFLNLVANNTNCMLTTEMPSTVYHIRARLRDIIEVKDIGGINNYLIKLNDLQNTLKSKHTDVFNSAGEQYDLYISKGLNNKVFASSVATINSVSNNEVKWNVSKKFLDFISNESTVRDIYLISAPNRKKCLKYKYIDGNLPIIFTDYEKNPISPSNIKIFKYDVNTDRKMCRIKNELINNVIFPDIFDLKALNDKGDVLIEVYESSIIDTGQKFDNNLSTILEGPNKLNKATYASNVLNNRWDQIKTYAPKSISYDHMEYIKSEDFGDYRAFLYKKLIELMNSDPFLYNELMDYIETKIEKKIITKAFTLKELNIKSSTLVTDNREGALLNNDKITKFKASNGQPRKCAVIKYRCENGPNPSLIYIFGKLVIPVMVYPVRKEVWVYIDVNDIVYHDTIRDVDSTIILDALYSNNFEFTSIQNEDLRRWLKQIWQYEAKNDHVIIDIFPNTLIDRPNEQLVNFNSIKQKKKLFDGKVKNISLADLVITDADTGEFIDLNNFTFNIDATNILVKDPLNNWNMSFIINNDDEYDYLTTLLNKIYKTKDDEPILLAKNKVEIPLNHITSDNVNKYAKRIDSDNITIAIKNKMLIGKKILISDRGNQLNIITGKCTNDPNNGEIIFNDVTISKNVNKYELYDGVGHYLPYEITTSDKSASMNAYTVLNIEEYTKTKSIIRVSNKIQKQMKGIDRYRTAHLVHLPIDYKEHIHTNAYKRYYDFYNSDDRYTITKPLIIRDGVFMHDNKYEPHGITNTRAFANSLQFTEKHFIISETYTYNIYGKRYIPKYNNTIGAITTIGNPDIHTMAYMLYTSPNIDYLNLYETTKELYKNQNMLLFGIVNKRPNKILDDTLFSTNIVPMENIILEQYREKNGLDLSGNINNYREVGLIEHQDRKKFRIANMSTINPDTQLPEGDD